MHANAEKIIKGALGTNDKTKRISLSKVLAGDSTELVKYILIVKPGYIESVFKERGLALETEQDYLLLPKIIELGLDKKGIEGSRGLITFDLRNLLEGVSISKDEIKESNITFVE